MPANPYVDPDSYLARMKRLSDYENYGEYGRKMARAQAGPGMLAEQSYRVRPDGHIIHEGAEFPGEQTVAWRDLTAEQREGVKRYSRTMEDAFGIMPGEHVSGIPWNTERLGADMAGFARGAASDPARVQPFGEAQARGFASQFGRAQAMHGGYSPGRALLDEIRQGVRSYRR